MTDLLQEILSLTADDYTPLWELESVAIRLEPSLSRSRLSAALLQMASDGLIAFYRGSSYSGEEAELLPAEASAALADDGAWEWRRARPAEFIQVAATGKGRVVYLTRSP
jgi:hypothetical protein